MANTARKRMKPGYTRRPQDDKSRRWQDIGDAPDSPLWKNREEWERTKAQREAAQRPGKRADGDWDELEFIEEVPRRLPFVYGEPRFVLIMTEDARDQLKANGHLHAVTARHNGFEYYFFAHTWDFNADLANYFDEGIDYQEGSIL